MRQVSLASLRAQIGKVTQETILFNDTVRNNIAYGQPDVPFARVVDAAKAALAHDFIEKMPDGYDTVIGEKGFRLSGGERQRLAIARAILKNAPVLILDEATSALDAESESLVQAALGNLMAGRTVIVIAHRLSTVRRASRIVVLENGCITAIGSHEELLQTSAHLSKALPPAVHGYRRRERLPTSDWRQRAGDPRDRADAGRDRTGRRIHRACADREDQPMSDAKRPVYSMTGFARVAGRVSETLGFSLSLKSVNHRFLDLHMRLPSGSEGIEMHLRRILKDKLHRGHVEVTLNLERSQKAEAGYDHALVAAYIEAFRAAATEHGLTGEPDLNTVFRLPGVLLAEARNSDEELKEIEEAVLREADALIAALEAMRAQEGSVLANELRAGMERLRSLVDEAALLREKVQQAYFDRLNQRMKPMLDGGFDQERILQEAALIAERSDVEEEVTRLRTHIDHFTGLLDGGGEVGKKLDFLLQEMNREANTLLSKTSGVAGNGTRITEAGLGMKSEIEKAREQVQNLE